LVSLSKCLVSRSMPPSKPRIAEFWFVHEPQNLDIQSTVSDSICTTNKATHTHSSFPCSETTAASAAEVCSASCNAASAACLVALNGTKEATPEPAPLAGAAAQLPAKALCRLLRPSAAAATLVACLFLALTSSSELLTDRQVDGSLSFRITPLRHTLDTYSSHS